MLTDNEIAEQARQMLTDELAGLAPPPGLLASVRAAHVRTRRNRHVATAALATVTAAGVTTALVSAASPTAATRATAGGPARVAARAATRPPGTSNAPVTQTIELDGYTIGFTSPVHLSTHACGDVAFRLSPSNPPINGGRPFGFLMLVTDHAIPAAAVRISDGHGPAYLLQTSAGDSVYLRLPAAWKESRTMIISVRGFTTSQVIQLARSLTILGHPAQLRAIAGGLSVCR
jgi:hypothetical protein